MDAVISPLSFKAVSKAKRMELVFQLCQAMRNMHALGIFHRDLKPVNVMLDAGVNVLLGDFGGTKDEASVVNNSEQTGTHTKFWADSNARASKFDYKSEVYAFGLTCYYILQAEPLYGRFNEKTYYNNEARNQKLLGMNYM